MMRTIRLFLGLVILNTGFLVNAQNIREIRAVYKRVNKELPGYTIKTAPVFGMSAEGGETTGYYKNDTIQKRYTVLLGETGKWFQESYFNKGHLVFVLETNHRYNAPIYFDQELADEMGVTDVFDIEKTEITEHRYYLKNDRIFKWLNSEENSENNSPEVLQKKTEDLLNDSQKLLKLLQDYRGDE